MHNGDVLGEEGRKALDACVKVKIYGKPETRRYDRNTAQRRLYDCYAGWFPVRFSPTLPGLYGDGSTYDIVDIRNVLVNFDERKYVEKYPKEGPGSDKLRDLIDKRRADVEKEVEEAEADPDGRRRYSWVVAQHRVRDCFAGIFAHEQWYMLSEKSFQENPYFNIIEIYDDFIQWDKRREKAEAKRADLEKEYAEAAVNPNGTINPYNHYDATWRVRSCYDDCLPCNRNYDDILPVKIDENEVPQIFDHNRYNIFDIHKALLQFGCTKLLQKYPEEGPGSEELKKLIDKNRNDLEMEYQKATHDTESETILCEYSLDEAQRRVRECFAGTFPGGAEIFPDVKKVENGQTYDIFDIKKAIDSFDVKTFVDACKYKSKGARRYNESKQMVDEQRAGIDSEYDLATSNTEIEHGSGFIVHDHFIITNKHVIETYLNEKESHEICISNEAIGELACKVIHYDPGKDLALLYCPDLNLKQSGICPLQLSSHSLLPGMSIFSFGYPISHTGKTALFVNGNVSGSREMLAGHSMVVLNCSLNSGNSGGPVMCWVKGQLRVVGVATQKHFKEILTLKEQVAIENIRKSLQTHAIPDVPKHVEEDGSFTDYYKAPHNHQTPMFLLTLKLYDALETRSQFNLSNALPGHLVVEFIKDTSDNVTGEHKEELEEIVKLSEDHDISSEH